MQSQMFKILKIFCITILILIVILEIKNRNERSNFSKIAVERIQLSKTKSVFTEKLLIDSTISEPLYYEWLHYAQKELPNVPFDYWIHHSNLTEDQITDCNEFPDIFKLNFHNTYWQTYLRNNITFQLFSAYYDKRDALPQGPVVRLLAMLSVKDNATIPENFCQLWYDNSKKAAILEILEYHPIYPKYWDILDGYLYPYLITCKTQSTTDKRVPRVVSLIKSKCEKAENSLQIWFEEPIQSRGETKRRFAVCVKGLDYPYTDNSARLVEWLELLRILGVSKVFMYSLAVHPNVSKLLAYYQKTDFVHLQALTLAHGEPSLPHFLHLRLAVDPFNKRLNEFIPFNDCLYKQMYKYDYIAALDVDEIIMPLEPYTNWQQLLDVAREQQPLKYPHCEFGFPSICFRNTFFYKEDSESVYHLRSIPKFMHMLRNTLRTEKFSDLYFSTKCFHNTSTVHTQHNHIALTWFKSCHPISLNESVAILQHYRQPCHVERLLQDDNIWRFKDELLMKTQQVLKETGLLQIN